MFTLFVGSLSFMIPPLLGAERASAPPFQPPLEPLEKQPLCEFSLEEANLEDFTNFQASLSGKGYPTRNVNFNLGAGLGVSELSCFSDLLNFPTIALFGSFKPETPILPTTIFIIVFENDLPSPRSTLKLNYSF